MKKCINFFCTGSFAKDKRLFTHLYKAYYKLFRYLEKQLLLNTNKKVVWAVFFFFFCLFFLLVFFFFDSITNIYGSNNITLKWRISQYRETDNECTSLKHFYRYISALILVNNTGHVANAIKLETINSENWSTSVWPTIMRNSLSKKLQVEILTINIFRINDILCLTVQNFFFFHIPDTMFM